MFGKNSNHSGNQKYSQIKGFSDSDSSSSDDENPEDDFIQRGIRQQQMMMKEQDQGLEMLGQSAERLSKISLGIHEELGGCIHFPIHAGYIVLLSRFRAFSGD